MKYLRIISRILVGLVFVFSGFVKGVDPLGSTYKFTDYFTAFGFDWAVPFAFSLAIFLCAAEFILGVILVFGIKPKLAAWGALLFMLFFTPLTLYLAIKNPVTDCGCFGEALIISNWATFWKNVVLIILVLIFFISRKKFKSIFNNITEWSIIAIFSLIMISISIYCYNHLPIMDFVPYSVGTHIPDKMKGVPDEYKFIYYYKNKHNGSVKEFTDANNPWQDTLNWEYVKVDQIVTKKGIEAPIHDFNFFDEIGDDYTDLILADPTYTFLIVSYNLGVTNREAHKDVAKLVKECEKENIVFIGATSSSYDEIKRLQKEAGYNITYYQADDIMLKTMIRSNPGIILLKQGTIVGKWHYNDIPTLKELKEKYLK